MHEVQVRHVGEQRVLTIERRTLVDTLQQVVPENVDRLVEHAARNGIEHAGPLFIVYHGPVTMEQDGPLEFCLPVTGPVEPASDMQVRLEPAHSEAYVRLTKAQVEFPEILTAYDALRAWLRENGRSTGMWSPREVSFADWGAIGPNDPACDVAWPFEK